MPFNTRKDIQGERFGRLTVKEYSHTDEKTKKVLWRCVCDCGNEKLVQTGHLRSGATKSCGCLGRENRLKASTTHGKRQSKLYSVYRGMKRRCNNPNEPAFKNYGGRGISVCEEWERSFEKFYDWAVSSGYADGLTIDRIDNDGNYCPDNCRWVTRKLQNSNKRNNRKISHNRKSQTMQQWAEELNIKATTLSSRINQAHWSAEKALTTPVKTTKRAVDDIA